MSERFWNFTKRPHYENFHIKLKQVSFIPLFWKVVTQFSHNLDYFCPFNDYFLIDRGCHDSMVVGFTTTCAISECHQWSCEFEYRSWWGLLDTTLCDNVYLWLMAGQLLSSGIPISCTNKTDGYDITEILLKVALNTTIHSLYLINIKPIMGDIYIRTAQDLKIKFYSFPNIRLVVVF